MTGQLSLRFERRGPSTVLTHSRSTLPLQTSKPMELDGSGALCVTLLNPTGGILGGDCLNTAIEIGVGAHAVLTTPSATKVYRTNKCTAFSQTTINLADDAVLEYVPDHLIPHPGSSLDQSLSVDMGPGSRAIILDSFSVGRVARRERWAFKDLTTGLVISRSGQTVFRDRIRIEAESWKPSDLGGTEGAGYMATMLLCADERDNWDETANTFTTWFLQDLNSNGAASPLANGGCLLRYQTHSAHCLNQVTGTLWSMARQLLLGQSPLDLRKG